VTSKLQLTVPKAIADQFGIKPGDELQWTAAGEAIRVTPLGKGERGRGPRSTKERLELFDQATQRQRRRQSKMGRRGKSRLRNVTVTLEDHVARWARLEAAHRDTSVSRLLGEILKEHMREKDEYQRALRRALGGRPFLKTDGRYLSREELHDRSHLRGH